jgi:hypothetical protein
VPSAQKFSPRLTDEQLAELVALLRQVDSVELKLTVPDEEAASTAMALGMDPLDAIIRQVYFFETPRLDLDSAGVVVRARRTQGKPDDSVVKLRPVVPNELPAGVRGAKRVNVELDALPGGHVCSASYKGELGTTDVAEVAAGERRVSKLFSKEQRAFYSDHAPEGLELDDLRVLGPVHVLKLKFSPAGYRRKLVAEMWLYPDGSRILELSTKCRPDEAFQVTAESRAYLAGRGVDMEAEQETKTRAALEFFVRKLR